MLFFKTLYSHHSLTSGTLEGYTSVHETYQTPFCYFYFSNYSVDKKLLEAFEDELLSHGQLWTQLLFPWSL